MMKTVIAMSATASPATVDIYGQPYMATAATLFARVQSISEEVITSEGEKERSSITIYLPDTATAPTLNSRFWLDGEDFTDSKEARRPKLVQKRVDENGNLAHWKVYL